MLTVERLNLYLGSDHILKNIQLQLNPGIHGLIGKSGSGKSSLLRCLAGLETYTGKVFGVDPTQLGFVEQSMTLFPYLTIQDNVAYPLQIRKHSPLEIDSAVRTMLEHCQIAALGRRYPHQISGGEQRRAMLARTLIYQPSLLLCDEPFTALDAITRYELVHWFKEVIPMPCTVVYVTHDLNEARYLTDHMLIMEQGELVQDSPLLHSHF